MTTATTDKEVRWRVNFKSLEKRIEAKKIIILDFPDSPKSICQFRYVNSHLR